MTSERAWRDAIRTELARLVRILPETHHPALGGSIFQAPLVGFAAADDPLFVKFKEVIGAFHRTPFEWLQAVGNKATGGTVISWILPISSTTRASNRDQCNEPSRQWAITRTFGETLNDLLRRHLTSWLHQKGYAAVAPVRHPDWAGCDDPVWGPSSNWSERHAAYTAGLGTFSLNDGLITPAGMAHRCGSVVTDLVLPTAPRPYQGIRDWCLFYSRRSCGVCMQRCPVGAISPSGHDKRRCRDYTYGVLQPHLAEPYGVAVVGCGLCQTGVPCEACNPCR